MSTLARSATHEVTNQPPPLENRDLFADNIALGEALVGPLSPVAPRADADALVAGLAAFCLGAVTDREQAHVDARP